MSRLKPRQGALPAHEFDPLKHEEWEPFWHEIDQHFKPITLEHVRSLRAIPANPFGGSADHHLTLLPTALLPDVKPDKRRDRAMKKLHVSPVKSEERKRVIGAKVKTEALPVALPTSNPPTAFQIPPVAPAEASSLVSTLNSFPFTQRLVAALLDEAPGKASLTTAPVIRSSRPGANDAFWIGLGSEKDVRSYQTALENRVKIELLDAGLIDSSKDDPLESTIRLEQWKLRDLKTVNRMGKTALYNRVIGTELRRQALDREIKRHNDQVEINYLERLIRTMKKNKKSRTKIQKLLQRMFGQYKEKEKQNDKAKKGVEASSNGRLLTNGEDKPRSTIKKKRKKSELKALAASSNNASLSRGSTH